MEWGWRKATPALARLADSILENNGLTHITDRLLSHPGMANFTFHLRMSSQSFSSIRQEAYFYFMLSSFLSALSILDVYKCTELSEPHLFLSPSLSNYQHFVLSSVGLCSTAQLFLVNNCFSITKKKKTQNETSGRHKSTQAVETNLKGKGRCFSPEDTQVSCSLRQIQDC